MVIETLELAKGNLLDILTDPSVYVIREWRTSEEGYRMEPIKDSDVKDVLNGDNAIIRITNN